MPAIARLSAVIRDPDLPQPRLRNFSEFTAKYAPLPEAPILWIDRPVSTHSAHTAGDEVYAHVNVKYTCTNHLHTCMYVYTYTYVRVCMLSQSSVCRQLNPRDLTPPTGGTRFTPLGSDHGKLTVLKTGCNRSTRMHTMSSAFVVCRLI